MKSDIKPDPFFNGLPSLTALKAFAASAHYKSFTDASKALCVTQSAVSRQVRELEEHLNVSLFARVGRSIELTEEGRKLYETAYICFSHIYQTVEEISECRKNNNTTHRKKLTIAMTHAFSVLWMAKKMSNFIKEFPDIDLTIYSIDDSKSMADDTSIDGYISLEPSRCDDYVSTALFCDKVFPVCSPKYLSEHPEITDVNHLKDADLLHLQGSQANQGFGWKQWLEFCGIDNNQDNHKGEKLLTASSYQFLIQMALDHQGIALGWAHLIEDLLKRGELVRPVSKSVTLGNYVHYFTHKKHSDKEYELLKLKGWLLTHL
ncbi:LysR family transcriptional regulator [Oceanimonas doudoroffii]|uniref:HTH lysR-type domain-containing protein n=1 Tax=Oceanimonas doudoroffii TaxID=84158 RepID=A0A233RII2_9GAMM|nr:LysR family transcriptional regulator [Oceanimonas doudoroffii]OXY83198.1 hypothetical protein B6S08_06800 [Oceanimonas doudoroffii]